MDIGSKIKQLRQKASMTQEQLGASLGISAQSVSKWETGVTMPDIALLPLLSGVLGVTIDEIFDLTTEQKLQRIERQMDIEDTLSDSVFYEYNHFLTEQLDTCADRRRVLSLLARLYHHRAESDLGKVRQYAREAILLAPEVKDCQWLLQKANGADAWDWNCSNHTDVINFYKTVIDSDTGTPKTPLPYYYLIDNLLADHRTKEAQSYLEIVKTLPAHRPFLIPVYRAYIALARFDAQSADRIMEEALQEFSDDPGFLFETAQYHARKCEYEKAIAYYERAWALEEDRKPRFTDELDGIATVYEILGDTAKAVETVERKIVCLREEWGYRDGDAVILEAEEQKKRLLK